MEETSARAAVTVHPSSDGAHSPAIAHKLFFRLYQTMNLSLRKATNVLRDKDMSPQQWSILDSLSRPDLQQGMTVNGLVDYLMVSRQSLNGVLKRMEDLGYVQRVINPEDHRSRMVQLTDLGREVWGKAGQQMKHFYDENLRHMTEEEKLEAIDFIERILANVKRF